MSNTAVLLILSPNLKLSKKLSFGEEVANSVTHAVGPYMLVLLPITTVHANLTGYMTTAIRSNPFCHQSLPHVFEFSHLSCYGL